MLQRLHLHQAFVVHECWHTHTHVHTHTHTRVHAHTHTCTHKNATDDQVKQVRAGKPLAQLDRVPNPAVPLPPQLATFRMPFMRPPFMPMMVRPPNVPSASNMPSAPFDPALPRPQVPTTIGGALAPPTGPVPPGSLVGTNYHPPFSNDPRSSHFVVKFTDVVKWGVYPQTSQV